MMNHFIKRALVVAICGLLLPACQYIQPAAPTRDADQLYTQVANTMIAGMLSTSQALPSATPEPTQTTTPAAETTANLTPVDTPQSQPPSTAAAQTSGSAGSSTGSTAAGPIRPGDQAQFVYHSPGKGLSVRKNSSWNLTLQIKNTGDQTWTTAYFLTYASGDRMGSPADYYLTQTVKPGEPFTFEFAMQAPDETGKKKVLLAFKDDQGNDLLLIDFDVNVIE